MKKARKKHKRRSSEYDPWDDPLSPPRTDPYKKRKYKGRDPYAPYPGWAPPTPEEEFYRQIAGGPVSFTRPIDQKPSPKNRNK